MAGNNHLTMINAVAGSGKTTLLVRIAEELKPKNGLYLAYNKAVARRGSATIPFGNPMLDNTLSSLPAHR